MPPPRPLPPASPASRLPRPRAHGFVRPLKKSVAPVARVLDRGLVVDSADILAERLEGGHVTLRLPPDIVAALGL